MSTQKHASTEELKEEANLAGIKEKFEQIKGTETHRTVKLVYKSCCGCGCTTYNIERKVASGSTLMDGDIVKDVDPDDKVWDSRGKLLAERWGG